MNMKQHIIAALREAFEHWEELLGGLSDTQILTPLAPSDWTIKDVMAHLWAWQQRSIARVEAAQVDREPQFPVWLSNADPDKEDNPDQTNAWIYETNRDLPWSTVKKNWKEGFQQFLKASETIYERDLLDSGRYPWLEGYPLALILLATYDHHQEHYEKLVAWLREHGNKV